MVKVTIETPDGDKTELVYACGVALPWEYTNYVPHGENYPTHVQEVCDLRIRNEDWYLATYPKCGTHWTWEIMAMLQRGSAEYEKCTKEAFCLDFKPISEIDDKQSPRILNCHFPVKLIPKELLEKKTKIVHVMRNPKDAFVSFYHHMKAEIKDQDFVKDFKTFLPYAMGTYGIALYYPFYEYMKEWEEFTEKNPDQILNLYYEDMKEVRLSDMGSKGPYLPTIKDAGQVSMCDVGVFNNPEDPRFYNIILEDEALAFRPCQDDKLAASLNNSKLVIIDGVKTSYQTGEIIHVRVDLYDGYGNKKNIGGDLIRATIHDMKGYHHAPGVVTDNLDGTYTVEIKAFWSGSSNINITLAYTREIISAVYRVRTQVLSTRNIYAKFQSRQYSEETLCHPNRTRLLAATNNSTLCDMTHDNSGMPFYCVKPKNVHLLCLDWLFTNAKMPFPVLSLTSCEKILFKRIHKQLRQHLTVNVNEGTACRISPKAPCSKYDITKTWISREPTGYFRGKNWTFVQCGGLTKDRIYECLRNKRLYLIGDSTLRHWYTHLLTTVNCIPITEDWTKEQWHKQAECVIKHIGFTAGWYPHSQPFCVGNTWADVRYTQVSITRRIENIPNDEEAIIVFQLYMHDLAFHHSVVQGRLALIRKTVETFLHRNNNSVVLIKGPHTFSQTNAGERLNDCYSGLYTKILYDTFKGLHDRVVLLNNKDATIAAHSTGNHPPTNIIAAMLEQMFSFACK